MVVEIPVLFATGILALSVLALEADGRFPLRVPHSDTLCGPVRCGLSPLQALLSPPPPHQHPPRARLDLPSGPKLRLKDVLLVRRRAAGWWQLALSHGPRQRGADCL